MIGVSRLLTNECVISATLNNDFPENCEFSRAWLQKPKYTIAIADMIECVQRQDWATHNETSHVCKYSGLAHAYTCFHLQKEVLNVFQLF